MKQLFNTILSAATAPELMEDALDAFCEKFELEAAALATARDFDSLRIDMRFGGRMRCGETPNIVELALSGGDAEDDPLYERLFMAPPQRLIREIELLEFERLEDLPSSRTRVACREDGIVERIGATLNQNGPWLDVFGVYTFRDGEAEQLVTDRLPEIALPLFAHAVSMNRMLGEMRQRFQGALGMLDRLGLGVFLIVEAGETILSNAEAQRILDLRDGLTLTREKRLVAAAPEATIALAGMITHANRMAAAEAASAAQRLAVARPSGAHPFLVTVRPLFDHGGELQPGLRCAFVVVIDPARPGALSAEGLVALAGLTPKESELARLLVAGYRLAEAAERRGVSLDTARNQLKSLSAKLRCSGQADVIRLAAATRLPLD